MAHLTERVNTLHPVPMDQLPAAQSHVHTQEISLFDKTDSRSVVCLVPERIAQAIEDAAFEHPEFFDKDERDLYKHLRSQEMTPSPTDNRLRLRFWDEYDRVQGTEKKAMNMANVLAGICSKELFYGTYLKRSNKVAWLMCPPAGYMIKAEEALEFGLEQLRDILEQPHVQFNKVDTKLGELKAKIVMMLDTRVKGAVLQKSMNLHVSATHAQVQKAATAATAEELMEQLKVLEAQNRKAQNLPPGAVPNEGALPDIEIK